MSYKTYLIEDIIKQLLENYKTFPREIKNLTMPEIPRYIRDKSQEEEGNFGKDLTRIITLRALDTQIAKPINDLVMMGKLDFDENLTLEQIVRYLKNLK